MMSAYDKTYLGTAQQTLGQMFDFAVNDLHYDPDEFFDLFIRTGFAGRFGEGEPKVVVGYSGVELVYEVLYAAGKSVTSRSQSRFHRSREYWCGWALAYAQWELAIPFREIMEYVSVRDVLELYSPYHEMDVRHFSQKLREMYESKKPDTKLKMRREAKGLSQSQLAEKAGIALRTIQHYEQRRSDINAARFHTLYRLAKTLDCDVMDLVEVIELTEEK